MVLSRVRARRQQAESRGEVTSRTRKLSARNHLASRSYRCALNGEHHALPHSQLPFSHASRALRENVQWHITARSRPHHGTRAIIATSPLTWANVTSAGA